ncbi:MAG: YeeE/YedE thiosulfate transporter family protein [Rhodoplanes sp.]
MRPLLAIGGLCPDVRARPVADDLELRCRARAGGFRRLARGARCSSGSSSWKASATAKSMRRYIVGAVLMGFGGKLAGGCAVGAGVSGGAIFAFTAWAAWVTLACIWVAAGVTDLLLDRDVDAPVGAASGGAY